MTVGRLIQAYRSEKEFGPQTVCMRGRSSGFSIGYTRMLKTVLVDWWHDRKKMVLLHGYSFAFTTSEQSNGSHGIRPGDSGSWIWDCETGCPVAQVTWGNGIDGMGVPLESVFDEMEAVMGHRPSLP